jgi:hypothetical protein
MDKPLLKDESQHMVPVRCPAGHTHYIDRRVACSGSHDVVVATRGDQNDIQVVCETCGTKFVVTLDCRGYR